MVLSLDTSTSTGDLAVVDTAEGTTHAHRPFQTERSHNSAIFPVLSAVLTEWADQLDCIAVGTGPGSYTGCRIGIAAAQALGLALGIPVRGVPSLCGIESAPARYAVCGDARRGSFFYSEVTEGILTLAPVLGDRAALVAALEASGLPAYTLDARPLGLGETTARPHAPTIALRVHSVMVPIPDPPVPIYLAAPFVTAPKQRQATP